MESSRRLVAIMFTDIVGYTALMGEDEETALQLLSKNRAIHKSIIVGYQGEWLKEMGDGTLASFDTSTDAVRCATAIQSEAKKAGIGLRIGIHVGEVVFEDKDVFGDGVNISSRIQELVPPGGIWVSESVHKNVLNKRGIETTFVREAHLKNVREKVRIYEAKLERVEASPIPAIPTKSAKTNQRNLILIVTGVLILLILGYLTKNYFRISIKDREPIEKSIAVMPFKNMSSDEENQHFCDGIMNDIIIHLSKIPELQVRPRTSAEQYRDNPPSLKKISEDLDVNYILTGSVQRIGDQAIIFVRLIYVATNNYMWTEKYERNLKDIFAIQSEVTKKIATELKATITPDTKRRIEVIPTEEIEAYDLYNKGRNYYYRYLSSYDTMYLDDAEEHYRKALDIDSTFALGYVGLGLVNLGRAGDRFVISKDEIKFVEKVGQLASKAINYDSELAEGYYLRGIYFQRKGEYKKAIADQNRAISLNPSMVDAYYVLALVYINDVNDFTSAMININKAIAIEKGGILIPLLFRTLSGIYMNIRAFEKTEHYLNESIRLQPDQISGYYSLWWTYSVQGKFEEALEMAEKVCQLKGPGCFAILADSYTWTKDFDKALEYYDQYKTQLDESRMINRNIDANMIFIYKHFGQKEKASQLLEETVAYWKDRDIFSSPFWIAGAYAALGDEKNAMSYLKKYEFKNFDGWDSFISYCPYFESLWDNEEFKGLVKKLKEEKAELRAEIFAMEAAGKPQ